MKYSICSVIYGSCDMAHLWGCKRLAYVAGWYLFGTKKQDAWNNTLDTLKQVAGYAQDKDITICIEPTSTDIM